MSGWRYAAHDLLAELAMAQVFEDSPMAAA